MKTVCGMGLAVVCLSVASLAGCADSKAVTGPSDAKSEARAGETNASVGASASDASLLASVKAATGMFHDVDKAVAAGYAMPVAAACTSSPMGIMGVHSVNMSLLMEPGVSAERPEALLYLPKPGGGFRLIGVEYLEFVMLRAPDGTVGPWVSPNPWPSDYVVVNQKPTLFGHAFDGPMPGHEPGMPWHWDFHVWAWQPNPNGMFAQWNSRLSCP